MSSYLTRFGLTVTAVSSLVAGCATAPMGPTVQVMPAPGKPFDLFQQEQRACQDYAYNAMGGQAAVDKANTSALANGVIATGVGAVAGGLVGAAGKHAGGGAQIGAAGGMVVGSAMAANGAARSTLTMQQLYDNAYTQCMYAKGNQVPGVEQDQNTPPPPTAYRNAPLDDESTPVDDEDPRLLRVQRELANMGYDPGSVNGVMSDNTRRAIRAFQRDNNLQVTGRLDPTTRSMLHGDGE